MTSQPHNRPAVTVLLPVHNGARYLKEAMDSILAQSLHDLELLVIDDCSTDDSRKIAAQYRDARVRLIASDRRLMLSGALNLGLAEAQGEYVARMDADDISLPGRLARQVSYLQGHSEVGICGGVVAAFDAGGRQTLYRFPLDHEELRAATVFDNPFAHPAVMFRKSLLARHGLRYDVSYYPAEDYELWVRALDCFRGANLAQTLLRYRIHPQSLTRSDGSEMDIQSGRIVESLLRKLGLEPTPEEVAFHRLLGTGRPDLRGMRSFIGRAEGWLGRVLVANRARGVYSQSALQRAVASVWYRVCYAALREGAWVVWPYFSFIRRHCPTAKPLLGPVFVAAAAKTVLMRGGGAPAAGEC